jgi:hypothetical protein
MQISVKVIPGAKKNLLKQEGERYKVYVTAPPVEGKANKALIAFLAQHFQVSPRQIQIIKGLKTRYKTINISDDSS